MMLPELEYVRWAHRHYGGSALDLASSGIPAAPASMLGAIAVDDWNAWQAFREGIGARYRVPSDEVMPTLGTSQALSLACAALLSPGDEVLVEAPTYEPLHRVPEAHGARVLRFERAAEHGYALNSEVVIAAMSPRTRMVLLTSPHNPSGQRVDDATLRSIHDALADRDGWLLVDEVYGDFAEGPPTSARCIGPRALGASSLTKRWGLGWARAGWLLAPQELVPRMATALRYATGQNGAAPTAIGLAALRVLPALEARADAIVGAGRAHVARWVAAHDELDWHAPDRGPYGFVRVDGDVDVRVRVEASLEGGSGVLVAPGEFFGTDRSSFRIGWTLPDDEIDDALEKLAQLLL